MKKFINLVLVLILIFSNFGSIFAQDNANIGDYLSNQKFSSQQLNKNLTYRGFFILYFNTIGEGIPESYKYIDLKFYNILPNTLIYSALQKGVYLDLIKNKPIDLALDKYVPTDVFARFLQENFGEELLYKKGTTLKLQVFIDVMNELKQKNQDEINTPKYEIEDAPNFAILNDVFVKLKTNHYDSEKFKNDELIDGAIKGLTESTQDKYTTYFPPVEAKNFNDVLSGEFEGIGANVDMEKPGVFKIVSPLSGSPAEKAGLKPDDIVTKIDGVEITDKISLTEAVRMVKGPAGTQVKLTILRGTQTLEITVTRAKITIPYVDYQKLNNGDNYIKITTFGQNTASAFSGAISQVLANNSSNKIILDLRNNPGGSLDEVARMLEFFVPVGEPVVNIKYKNFSQDMLSTGIYSELKNKKVIILINKGSASASEIMAGTIRDYLGANVKIIGETSYGKGSVQTIESYYDGSSVKYTIAKWFTGKTKTGIDGIGIVPDIELKEDETTTTTNNPQDKNLDYAKNFRF